MDASVDFRPEDLLDALEKRDVLRLRRIFEDYNIVDIAETLDRVENPAELAFVFKTVSPEYTGQAFTYLEPETKERLVASLSSTQLKGVLEYIYTDDIVDFLEDLPANLVAKIIKAAAPGTRQDINHLLNYKENSAGSIMTTEYVQLKANETAPQAIARIRRTGKEAETISYLFVTDSSRQLVGTLRLKDIVFAEDDDLIGDIMDTDFVSVKTSDDQEEVARYFKKYDLNALPVITNDGRLVGIITADDIIDVIEQEATEDIQKMAAMQPLEDEYLKLSPLKVAKKRIIWLLVLMVGGTFTGLVVNNFENLLVALPALTVFIPMIMDTGGNSGGQASATIVRSLALGEITARSYGKVLVHEIAVATITGGLLGLFSFGWIHFEVAVRLVNIEATIPVTEMAFLVALTVFITVFIAKTLGATLPIIAKKLGGDPALMAEPLLTTIVDTLSLVIYFFLATKIFNLL